MASENIGNFNAKMSVDAKDIAKEAGAAKQSIQGVTDELNKSALSAKALIDQVKKLKAELTEAKGKLSELKLPKSHPQHEVGKDLKSQVRELLDAYKSVESVSKRINKTKPTLGQIVDGGSKESVQSEAVANLQKFTNELQKKFDQFSSTFKTFSQKASTDSLQSTLQSKLGVLKQAAGGLQSRNKSLLPEEIFRLLGSLSGAENIYLAGDYLSALNLEAGKQVSTSIPKKRKLLQSRPQSKQVEESLQELTEMEEFLQKNFLQKGSGGFYDVFSEFTRASSRNKNLGRPKTKVEEVKQAVEPVKQMLESVAVVAETVAPVIEATEKAKKVFTGIRTVEWQGPVRPKTMFESLSSLPSVGMDMLKDGTPVSKVVATLASEAYKVTGVFGMIAAGLASVAKAGQSYLAFQQRFAYAFGMTGQQAAGFQRVSTVLGESAISIENRYELIQSRLGAARNAWFSRDPNTGLPFSGSETPEIQAIRRIGLDPDQILGSRDTAQVMGQLIDALNRMPDAISRVSAQREIFGREFQLLTPVMQAGGGFLADQARRARMFGAVGTERERVDAFRVSLGAGSIWADMKNIFQSIGRTISTSVLPPVIDLGKAFMDLIAPFASFSLSTFSVVGSALKVVLSLNPVTTPFIKFVEVISPALSGLAEAFQIISDAVSDFAGVIIDTANNIFKHLTNGSGLTDFFQELKEDLVGFASMVGDMIKYVGSLVKVDAPAKVVRNNHTGWFHQFTLNTLNAVGGPFGANFVDDPRRITEARQRAAGELTPQEALRIFGSNWFRGNLLDLDPGNLIGSIDAARASQFNFNHARLMVPGIRDMHPANQDAFIQELRDLHAGQGRQEFANIARGLFDELAEAGLHEAEILRRRLRVAGGGIDEIRRFDEIYGLRRSAQIHAEFEETFRSFNSRRRAIQTSIGLSQAGRPFEGTIDALTSGQIQRAQQLEEMLRKADEERARSGTNIRALEADIERFRIRSDGLARVERLENLSNRAAEIRANVRSPEVNLTNQLESLAAMRNNDFLNQNQFSLAIFKELSNFMGIGGSVNLPQALKEGSVEAASAVAQAQRTQIDPIERVNQTLLGIRDLMERQLLLGQEAERRIRAGALDGMMIDLNRR